jgi:putative molybdopterin biosynthesis protein
MKSLTPQEVADMLKIAKNTVYELVKRGELNAYRVGRKMRIDFKDVEEYKRRTSVGTYMENESIHVEPTDGLVICGQDVVLDILARYLQSKNIGVPVLRSHLGSYNGLYALYQGDVHVATAHLWDGDTGEYNIPYIKSLLPGIPTVIVHLVCRMQGFYVKEGNPLDIKGWEDLKRPKIKIINREKGSGVRVLLDEHLRLLGIYGREISGYERVCTSHIEAASAVSRGEADLALGKEMAARQVKGIEFIPLQKESIELIMKKEDSTKPVFRTILEILKSKEFSNEIKGIGGYDVDGMGNIF